MATQQSVLFSWDDVEGCRSFGGLKFVLDQLPDEGVVSALEARRGRGRNSCPARAIRRALVTGVVFGHESSASLLRELGQQPTGAAGGLRVRPAGPPGAAEADAGAERGRRRDAGG